ncbi:uncharacterized protein LOC124792633 [Schistocerca piceifrons]|uniref:uncharacterized protein LOC124792633 n=1 Tax=Schistocerca piceifrons TaxID=274613 RepID=UPI001F5EB01B|nr:uncharacterized protein LOC124792633 [Schistocerca piceifrons]
MDEEDEDMESDEDLQDSLEGDDDGGSGADDDDSDESDEEYADDDYLEYTLPAPVGAAAAETPDQRLRDKYADVLAGMASKLQEAKRAEGNKASNLSSSSSEEDSSSSSSSSSSSGSSGGRSRREISSASESGVPVIDESYGAPLPRAHNATSLRLYETLVGGGGPTLPPTDSPIKKHHRVSPLWSQPPKKYHAEQPQQQPQQQQDEWRGHRGGTPPPAPLITRASRVMDTDGDRSVRIPYSALQHRRHHHQQQPQQQRAADPARPQELRQLPDSTARKQHMAIKRKKLRALSKRKHPAAGTSAQHHLRPMPAVHFYGDSSNHTVDQDRYLGNGRLRPENKLFTDWTPEDWFHRLGMDQHFTYEGGVVTVRRSGLYYVYAQIFYLDDKSTNGFKVLLDGEPKMQCSLHIHIAGTKSNTCFTASVMYINENSRLSLHDIEANRYSVFDKSKSFFGLVKLGNARLP